jgi:hypothetical protein
MLSIQHEKVLETESYEKSISCIKHNGKLDHLCVI